MCIELLLIVVSIACTAEGFLELFCSCPVATVKSLSSTYGKPDVSYCSLDTYLGKVNC